MARWAVTIWSDDYYRSEEPATYLLPDEIKTREEGIKFWDTAVCPQIHLSRVAGGSYESLDHYRCERGNYEGHATFNVRIKELSELPTIDNLLREWCIWHPANAPGSDDNGTIEDGD